MVNDTNKQDRLAGALRANLRRRKAARKDDGVEKNMPAEGVAVEQGQKPK